MNNHKDVDSMAGNITLGFYRKLYSGMRTGKRINSVSVGAALLFWHLHTVADDYGNLHGDADLVRTWAAPRRKEWDDDTIESMLNELASGERPLIVFYRADGELFIHIEDFEEVQPAGKNGKRVQKHPIHTGGIRVNPGESKGIQGNPEIPGESGSPMPMPITMPMQIQMPTPMPTQSGEESPTAKSVVKERPPDDASLVPIPEPLDTTEFRQLWQDWIDDRKKRNKKMTALAAKLQLKKLLEIGHDRAIIAIETSIANGYQGIFEPRGSGGNADGSAKGNQGGAAQRRIEQRAREFEEPALQVPRL